MSPPLSRRGFLGATAGVAGAFLISPSLYRAGSAEAAAATTELPMGTAPAPLTFAHFPGRLHAYVWRNWPLVPATRLAKVVGARASEIERLGKAMGLGPQPAISRQQQERSYITIIKRNWHLLPYPQLLELLGWTAEQLRYTLREDDFLWVKLGNLKPKCQSLRYEPPNELMRRREQQIARQVREHFPTGIGNSEPLFAFIERLSRDPGPTRASTPSQPLKFCYSYFAQYGDPLLDRRSNPYPDGLLARLAQSGVNGVWLQAVLYKLARFPWDPSLSAKHEARLKNLRQLVRRAALRGMKIFLYLNEPRAMPLAFYERHPALKGAVEGDHAALCTSQPAVRQYLVQAVASICRAVPGLGGYFSITASENLTNCWSHYGGASCPRCAARSAAEVIAEVNGFFCEGIRAAGSSAKMIAWDWGWKDEWAGETIQRLPPEILVSSVSEWRLPLERGGIKTEVGEYSISAVGPGPRARQHWQVARQRGLNTIAKVQVGNTWELSAVPWIPAGENVARHGENLRNAGVSGFMLGWTLGGYPSPNLEIFSEALAGRSAAEALERVAQRRFGRVLGPAVASAWQQFSAAFREFPYHGGVLYSAPQQLGPANLLWAEPTNYAASMVGFPYDDLDGWRAVYPPAVFIQQFEKVAEGFNRALADLSRLDLAAESISVAQREAFEEECRMAEAAAIHFRSTANQARFVMARRALAAAQSAKEAEPWSAILQRTLEEEIPLARRLHAIQSKDSRIGFEATNQYYYVPLDLVEKVVNCRHLLGQQA